MRRCLGLLAALFPAVASAQGPDSAFLAAHRWRSIGPANMSGRVSGLAVNPLNPKVIYAGFATGGIWKSVNAGTTWQPVFDNTGSHAVSEVIMAPSDTSILWAGTGEEDSRNSISPGEGVFKSTDAGRTWTHMGLRESSHIGHIAIHPTNPDIVFVAALGRAWGANAERGLYKTTDGGRTWRLVNFVSNQAGFIDVVIDPSNPNTMFAASWERVRSPYSLRSGGPGSALWRSDDGGETWARVTGNGLPTTMLGRIGLAIAPSNPRVVYAILEADSMPNPATTRRGFRPDSTMPRQRLQSGLFRSQDGGATWQRMNRENNRPFYYSVLAVDPRNADRVYWLSTQLRYSNDGGLTYRTVGAGIHVDYHAIWINPNDPDHYIVGEDGGLAQTYDRGRTYDAILQMAVGQFYAVGVDMQRPFWVCGGLQDNGTWCGPTESPRGVIRNQDWYNVNGGDGFYAAIDPTNPDIIFGESQGGNIMRLDLRTWQRSQIRPGGGGFGGGLQRRLLEDSILIARGDSSVPASAAIQRIMDSLRTRITRDTAVLSRNRFNWSSPFFISSHNPRTLYMGGHRVWKTVNHGDQWMPISDDLSLRDTARIRISIATTGGITLDATTAETHGTVTALSESPLRPGILWAGTDDGNVWLTRNDGATWENLTGRFPGVPRLTWVSRVRASSFDTATVYVTFDGHRSDDFRPHVYVSNDFGRTFRSISAGLPATEYVHAFTDNPRRRGLLFAGTEKTAYVSVNDGASWSRFNSGLPPAPVHDLVVHPRDRILVAGTHGRSIWTIDIGPLEQAHDSVMTRPVHVFAPEVALLYTPRVSGGGVGAVGWKLFSVPNTPFGARIPVRIQGAPDVAARDTSGVEGGQQGEGGPGGPGGPGGARRADTVLVAILDVNGDTVRTLRTTAGGAALRYISWDLRRNRQPLSISQVRDSVRNAARQRIVRDSLMALTRDTSAAGERRPVRDPQPTEPGTYNSPIPGGGGGGGGGGGFGGGGQGAFVEPGLYRFVMRLNGQEYSTTIRVERASAQQSALSGGWQ